LVAFFVRRVGSVKDLKINLEYLPVGSFKKLVASWMLQGGLARPLSCDEQHLGWLNAIREAVRRLEEWIEAHPSSLTKSLTLSDTSAISIRSTEIVCNALVCHLGPHVVSSRLSGRITQPKVTKDTTSHIVYLAACFIGDVLAVQHALASLQYVATNEEQLASMNSGLLVAARQGNQDVIKYLLDAGFNANTTTKHYCAIIAAAESGKIHLIELLLRPEYQVEKSGVSYEDAILFAAEHLDPVARLEMVKILFAHAEVIKPQIRFDVLFRASELNDPELAEFVLAHGPINLYDKANDPRSDFNPLLKAVVEGHFEIVRLILKTHFEVDSQEHFDIIQRLAFKYAKRSNSLPIFTELIPHQKSLDANKILKWAAEVEYGVEAVEKILGSYNFNASTNEDGETLLGAVVLRSAALALRPRNVTWLLSHGVRTQNAVPVEWGKYQSHVDDFQKMDQILKAYQNPGMEVLCCPDCHDPGPLSGHRPASSHTRCLHTSGPNFAWSQTQDQEVARMPQ
jgi:ankyrin repeat protein